MLELNEVKVPDQNSTIAFEGANPCPQRSRQNTQSTDSQEQNLWDWLQLSTDASKQTADTSPGSTPALPIFGEQKSAAFSACGAAAQPPVRGPASLAEPPPYVEDATRLATKTEPSRVAPVPSVNVGLSAPSPRKLPFAETNLKSPAPLARGEVAADSVAALTEETTSGRGPCVDAASSPHVRPAPGDELSLPNTFQTAPPSVSVKTVGARFPLLSTFASSIVGGFVATGAVHLGAYLGHAKMVSLAAAVSPSVIFLVGGILTAGLLSLVKPFKAVAAPIAEAAVEAAATLKTSAPRVHHTFSWAGKAAASAASWMSEHPRTTVVAVLLATLVYTDPGALLVILEFLMAKLYALTHYWSSKTPAKVPTEAMMAVVKTAP